MKVLVAVKRVLDFNLKVRVKPDHSGVNLDNVKMSINPFDEIAVEEALRLKEKSLVDEIILVSVGSKACQETIRQGMAMGADRGIHVECQDNLEPLSIAKLIAKVVEQENLGLVLLGKQSIDGDNNQTGQMLAAILDWPQATFVSDIAVTEDTWQMTREVDGGLERLQVTLPAVVTTDLRLNQPRYASLPNIMKAKKKPLHVVTPETLGVEVRARLERLKVMPPSERKSGIRLESVAELVNKLRSEAKVIA